MSSAGPERELRARERANVTDRHATTYKVYLRGRLRGAIVPIPEDENGARWEAIDLTGPVTRWRYRDLARDHLCREDPASPDADS